MTQEQSTKYQLKAIEDGMGISPEAKIANFVHLIKHYVVVKGILTPEEGFEYIECWLSGKNPFQDPYYLKKNIRGMRVLGFGPLYLSNDYLNSAFFQQIWG